MAYSEWHMAGIPLFLAPLAFWFASSALLNCIDDINVFLFAIRYMPKATCYLRKNYLKDAL